jgi:competence protein ComFC
VDLLDLIFPRVCVGCGKTGAYLCASCQERATKQWLICPNCRRPSPLGQTHESCKTKHGLDGLVSIYKYNGTIKKLIGKLKYGYVTDIARTFSDTLVASLTNYHAFKTPTLVPVPLSSKRKRWRGFNQTEIIGEKVAHQLGWNYQPDLVRRILNRHPQVGLKNDVRMRNTCGEFAVNEEVLILFNQGNTIVLFDDVWTTGSTIKEVCKTLKIKGYTKVWGVTIAR